MRSSRLTGSTISRRRGLSFDGNAAGVPYVRYRGGKHFVTAPVNLSGSSQLTEYQSGHSFYQDMSVQYDQPESWFEHLHVSDTPMLKMQQPHFAHSMPATEYDDNLMTPELMEHLLQQIWHPEELEAEQQQTPVPLEFAIVNPHGTPEPNESPAILTSEHGVPDDTSPSLEAMTEGLEIETNHYPDPYEQTVAQDDGSPDMPVFEEQAEQFDFMTDAMPTMDHTAVHDYGGLEQIVNDNHLLESDPMPEHMAEGLAYGLPEMTHELFAQTMEQTLEQQPMADPMQVDPYQQMQQMVDEQMEMRMPQHIVPNPMMPGP